MRRFLNPRSFFIFLIVVLIITLFGINKSSPPSPPQIDRSDPVQLLLTRLFHPSTTLDELQLSWNELVLIWESLLLKFVRDACHLCHANDPQCSTSVDIDRYIYHINESFYPVNDTQRPHGMGLYYDFDLALMRSLNNSISTSDVTPCDYFHMLQLLIHVQSALHEDQVEYLITKGTLIGSLRHHDVIPWDTDIDIFIPYSSLRRFLRSFKQLRIDPHEHITTTMPTENTKDSVPLHRKDLVVYQFRNSHKVTSYKIFSLRSPRVNKTHYRWPKIDVFPYHQSRTHIYAFPRHKHNIGTMGYLAKTDVYPINLRPLGPLLVPTPQNLHQSLKAMVQLGRSNVFDVCEGNTFLHRSNRVSTERWRVPCRTLSASYPFVISQRDSSSGICTETLLLDHNGKKNVSLYKYKCREHLPRTLG